ncbi:hypothetical protein KFL_006780030 [Klebsormidium nitens]|uniref:BolA protein n=1 Tax=Klebsormidium nitens TaxID=105231 RepID=A0A1Y1IKR3_KLENI|nr:hypothetical protein KFL_006780030 [Klebsormidium nitens]|eukprot:GAQ90732.1 hypothetical protein KFL_006780030 [Klebsormidium nitens]
MANNAVGRPLFSLLDSKLRAAFNPVNLTIVNESRMHAGHSGNPSGDPDAETHFRVEMISEAFEKKPLVQRHRQVYDLLKEELEPGKIHALALKLKTPSEAEKEASKRTL